MRRLITVSVAAAAASPCDKTIPGYWSCINCGGTPSYALAWNASFTGAFTVTSHAAGWSHAAGQFDADNATATIVFDNGHHGNGTVTPACDSVVWNDNTIWDASPAPLYSLYNVHLSPHTHDDVGWDETYMQYYDGTGPIHGRNVSRIISNVVAALLADPSRRFSYVEQAFFQIWFERQSTALQAQVRGLVASKQLVFLNGGWSMHDEANPTYVDMLDNTAVGQRAILDNFGAAALPTLAWQIDPFGHSAFQGVLSSPLGGYVGLMWGREPADFKAACVSRQGGGRRLERVWSPSASLGAAAAAYQGVFVTGGYGTPDEANRCDYDANRTTCAYARAAEDAAAIVQDLLGNVAGKVRGNDVLFLFGDDFTWENALETGNTGDYFAYVDGVRDALNADPLGRFRAFYSTPADYVAAKLKNVSSLPALVTDMFPYNDDTQGHNMWAGYFTSRPAFKGFVRESGAYQQAARQLQALVGGVTNLGPSNPLFALERAMGVAQHHDSVAGTAQQNVNDDYSLILEGGRAGAYASISASLAAATGDAAAASGGWALCPLANVTVCAALETGTAPAVALLYNALGQGAPAAGVRVPVGMPAGVASWAVADAAGKAVTAQLVPLSARDTALRALYLGAAAPPVAWLVFEASLPAAGFAAYFLSPQAAAAGAPATHASVVTPLGAADGHVTNGRLTLTIAAATGFLSAYADAATGLSLPLAQSWLSYVGFDGNSTLNGSRQSSGAYIFRPANETALPLLSSPATVTLVTGPVLNEAQSEYGYVSQSTRLWASGADVELEWTVGPVDVSDNSSHEVITRYDAGAAALPTGGVWTTDSNCRESQLRTRNARGNWTATVSEPVAGNYAPVNCLIKASSPAATLAVAVDRSEGGASLADGQLELMVHRRMKHDDGRGVGEPLNEPGLDGKGLIIRGRHWLVAAPAAAAPAAYKALQQRALALPTAVAAYAGLDGLSPAQWAAAYTASASLLTAPLPANVHLATVHTHNGSTLLLRLAHTYDAGEEAALSGPVTVELAGLLAGRTIAAAVEMTLPGTQPLAGVPLSVFHTDGGATYTVPVVPPAPSGPRLQVTLTAQQIRTFMCTLAPAAAAAV